MNDFMPLSAAERDELKERETRIRRDIARFIAVGEDLLAIKEKMLFREKYKTFEAYVIVEFSIKNSHAHRLMDAFKVATNLNGIGPQIENERQARELAQFTPETQRAVWATVLEKHPNGQTAAHIEEEVEALASKAFASLPAKDRAVILARDKTRILRRERDTTRQEHIRNAINLLKRARKEIDDYGFDEVEESIDKAISGLE